MLEENIPIIIFKDEGEPINTNIFKQLSDSPHVYITVQPFQSKYRVICFKNKEIELFEPLAPSKYLLSGSTLIDFLLTKSYNSIIAARLKYPILHEIPRLNTINEVAEKCLKRKKKKIRPKNLLLKLL